MGMAVALVILYMSFNYLTKRKFVEGFREGMSAGYNSKIRYIGAERSDPGLQSYSGSDMSGEVAKDLGMVNGFSNSREAPYFPDVTNRVLRMENREKEAVRALGKINQERLRRTAEDSATTAPLPWNAFWNEWKQTHPLDGEEVSEGFKEDELNAY